MFRFVLCTLTGTLLFLPLNSLADDFRDFRIPSHKVHQWLAGGSFRSQISNTNRDTQINNSDERNETHYAEFTGETLWLWEKEHSRTRLFAGASANVDHTIRGGDGRSTFREQIAVTSSSRSKDYDEHVQTIASQIVYPFVFPLGVELSASASAFYHQLLARSHSSESELSGWTRNASRQSENWDYRYDLYGRLQAGWGRVRDATGVYLALITEERLREEAELQGSLAPATRQALAELFYRSGDYSLTHLRPQKYFWSDFWKILQSDSAVSANAENVYNNFRLAEAPAWGGVIRQTGWFVGPTYETTHDHEINRFSSDELTWSIWADSLYYDHAYSYSRTEESRGETERFGLRGEYHRPVGYCWQFDLTSNLSRDVSNTPAHFRWESSLNSVYIIADRWRAVNWIRHLRSFETYTAGRYYRDVSEWSVFDVASLSYFLEDRWSIDAYSSYFYRQYNDLGLTRYRGFEARIGFTYGPRPPTTFASYPNFLY